MTGIYGLAARQAAAEHWASDNPVQVAKFRAERIRSNTRERIKLITEGLEAGDWRTLGYESPATWYADLTDFMLAPAKIRRLLAEALRAEGYSLRRIATELDVSKDTAARDLAEVSHDATPDRVDGADGKTYPAKRPERCPPVATLIFEPVPEPEPERVTEQQQERYAAAYASIGKAANLLSAVIDAGVDDFTSAQRDQLHAMLTEVSHELAILDAYMDDAP